MWYDSICDPVSHLAILDASRIPSFARCGLPDHASIFVHYLLFYLRCLMRIAHFSIHLEVFFDLLFRCVRDVRRMYKSRDYNTNAEYTQTYCHKPCFFASQVLQTQPQSPLLQTLAELIVFLRLHVHFNEGIVGFNPGLCCSRLLQISLHVLGKKSNVLFVERLSFACSRHFRVHLKKSNGCHAVLHIISLILRVSILLFDERLHKFCARPPPTFAAENARRTPSSAIVMRTRIPKEAPCPP